MVGAKPDVSLFGTSREGRDWRQGWNKLLIHPLRVVQEVFLEQLRLN